MKILITGGSGFIGTNLVQRLISKGNYTVLNLDISKPNDVKHNSYWKDCSIMDLASMTEVFKSFQPDAVIHLAAKTDTNPENTIEDYNVNTIGSENVLAAIKGCNNIKRVLMTSTQFVNQYHGSPRNDEDFAPHTVYGISKVEMEKMTRNAGLNCTWTIIRPTNIWGPWHLRYPFEFWKIVSKGLYFHPGKNAVIRSYGYVGNIVFQVISILESPVDKISEQVFYVGDMPIDILNWVNGFSLKQIGRKVIVVPRIAVRLLGFIGDVLTIVKIGFPITSSRYKSMTHSNTTPMEKTFKAFGNPPYSLDMGIEETVEWMKQYHPDLVKIQ